MYSLLLAIIYLSFISLGLPDSLIGSAWPIMHVDLGVSMSSAGIITIIISVGTVISSFFSNTLTNKLGTGLVTAISVAFTALGLIGFSFAKAFWMLCVFAIPYGIGAGAVDAALNNYVALNYPARHLSWLHCMWGVGASISPYIMSYALTGGLGWENGFRIVFYIQIALSAVLFFALPVWRKCGDKYIIFLKNSHRISENASSAQDEQKKVSTFSVFKIKGIVLVFIAFFSYCAMEQTAGLWATSYLVNYKGINPAIAAKFASFFYIGITAGRGISGFFADKLGDKRLIRFGTIIVLTGILLVALPVKENTPALVGLIVIGLGCAPIYPAIIHSAPDNFGKENSQAVIGIQMAFAYIGITAMPPLFGVIAEKISIGLYWAYLLVFALLMLVMCEALNAKIRRKYFIKCDEYKRV